MSFRVIINGVFVCIAVYVILLGVGEINMKLIKLVLTNKTYFCGYAI